MKHKGHRKDHKWVTQGRGPRKFGPLRIWNLTCKRGCGLVRTDSFSTTTKVTKVRYLTPRVKL